MDVCFRSSFFRSAFRRGGGDVSFDTSFSGGQKAREVDRRVPDRPSFRWSDGRGLTGLRFESRGMDLVTRPFEVGTGPFEFSTDVTLTKGTGTKWPRFKGVNVVISSAPGDRMEESDWAVLFSVVQAGVRATVRRGGVYFAKEVKEGEWEFSGGEIDAAKSLTKGNASMSVRWPSTFLAGRSVRFHVHRNRENVLVKSGRD